MADNFLGQIHVALSPARLDVIAQRGLAMTGRLCQSNISRNGGGAKLVSEISFQLGRHLLRQVGAIIKHGEDHAFDCQIWIEAGTDPLHCIQQLRDSFERKVFRLHWN